MVCSIEFAMSCRLPVSVALPPEGWDQRGPRRLARTNLYASQAKLRDGLDERLKKDFEAGSGELAHHACV